MKDTNRLVRVYVGTEMTCLVMKSLLEEIGVTGMIKNDFRSSIQVGYVSGTPSSIELYIYESDLDKSATIIKDFKLNNPE